jgi:hypothetical protein
MDLITRIQNHYYHYAASIIMHSPKASKMIIWLNKNKALEVFESQSSSDIHALQLLEKQLACVGQPYSGHLLPCPTPLTPSWRGKVEGGGWVKSVKKKKGQGWDDESRVHGQLVDDDDDDSVINQLSPSPSYPNNPQPSHTLAVNASDDIMSLSMIKLDAPYPIKQSRSISPMIQWSTGQ